MDDHTRHETSENLLYAAAERGLVGLCEVRHRLVMFLSLNEFAELIFYSS